MPLRYLVGLNQHVLPEDTDPTTEFKYVEISDVSRSAGVVVPAEKTTFAQAPSRARRLAVEGDTVVSTVRTYLRAVGKVPATTSSERLVFSTGFAVLHPRHIDPRYLSYCCRSDPFIEEVVAKSVGVSYPAINAVDLLGISVKVGSLQEQRRIADFLDDRIDRLDRIIAARREQVAMARSAAFSAMSAQMDADANAFGTAALRRFCRGIEQGSSPIGEDVPAGPGEAGVLKTSAIIGGAFEPARNKRIPPEVADHRHVVADGDVLITRGSGSAALVGDAAVVRLGTYQGRLYLSDLTYRLVRPMLIPDYVVMSITSARGRSELGTLVRQGSGPAKARGDDVLSLPVPNAPRERQLKSIETVRGYRDHANQAEVALTKSIELLAEYKTSLITAAVTGELDVTTAGSGIPG
ncbi:restriction endonuclease subunit S [Auraticoccus cholistanensis]|uniref:restriction endonuclease subunit S n=1 Tax=Auraticoccus cholistanensis TaxID=2656650 RepID=UPI0018D21C23